MNGPKWLDAFEVADPETGVVDPGGAIGLRQLDRRRFALASVIRYREDTGLESWFGGHPRFDEIRVVGPAHLPETDLVSVPKPLRWFAGRYGDHTPAALIHDWFIGIDPADKPIAEMTDQHADRYFRFMLHRIGVRWLRRWIMWAAVALRTRFAARGLRRWTVVAWMVGILAVVGLCAWALVTARWGLAWAAAAAPVPMSLLWGRQLGAGLVAAYVAPVMAPPTLLAIASDALLWAFEWLVSWFVPGSVSGDAEIRMESL